jgi:hypothetical protein
MAEHGHSGISIARHLGRTAQSVRVEAVVLGIRLRPVKSRHEPRFPIEEAHWRKLVSEARERGVSVNKLCRHLLETICRDRLFDAVLDTSPRPRALGQPSGKL